MEMMNERTYNINDFYVPAEERDDEFLDKVFSSLAQLGHAMYHMPAEEAAVICNSYPALYDALAWMYHTMTRDEDDDPEILDIDIVEMNNLPSPLIEFITKVRDARVQDIENMTKEYDASSDESE